MPPIQLEPPAWHSWEIPKEMEQVYTLFETFKWSWVDYSETPWMISWWLLELRQRKIKLGESLGIEEDAALKIAARKAGATG